MRFSSSRFSFFNMKYRYFLSEQRLEVGGAVMESKRYRRDPLARLTGIDLDCHPEKSLCYAYDQDDRLTGSLHGTEQHHYVLNPAGNRIDPQPRSREAVEEEWRETVRRNLHDPNFNVLAHTLEDAIRSANMWFDNRITDRRHQEPLRRSGQP
jgi:hypothetical protein